MVSSFLSQSFPPSALSAFVAMVELCNELTKPIWGQFEFSIMCPDSASVIWEDPGIKLLPFLSQKDTNLGSFPRDVKGIVN